MLIRLFITQVNEIKNYCGRDSENIPRQSGQDIDESFRQNIQNKLGIYSKNNHHKVDHNIPLSDTYFLSGYLVKNNTNNTYDFVNIFGKYHTNISSSIFFQTPVLTLPPTQTLNTPFSYNFLGKHLIFDQNFHVNGYGELTCYKKYFGLFSLDSLYRSRGYKGKIIVKKSTIRISPVSIDDKKNTYNPDTYGQEKIDQNNGGKEKNIKNDLYSNKYTKKNMGYIIEIIIQKIQNLLLSHNQQPIEYINLEPTITYFGYKPHYSQVIHEALLWGILLGDTTTIPVSIYNLFIKSGLVYLISASGSNIATFITLISILLFFIPHRYKKYIVLLCITIYAGYLGDNIALRRAYIGYLLYFIIVKKGYLLSAKRKLILILFLLFCVNPYLIVSSWGLLLSTSGVLGIIHTPYSITKKRVLGGLCASIFANIGLIGPLLFLVQTYNLLTILLGIVVAPLVFLVIILYVVSFIPYIKNSIYIIVDIIIRIASWGVDHGIYITTTIYISIIIRLFCRTILLIIGRKSRLMYYRSVL